MSSNLKVNTILPSTGNTVAISGIASVTSSISIASSCTATTFYGDGSNLTGVSGVTINGNVDNRLVTATGTTGTINGEANLTFDGSSLNNTNGDANFTKSANNYILVGSTNASGASLVLDGDSNGDGSGTDYAFLTHNTDGDLDIVVDNPANAGNIKFFTNSTTERLRITSGGQVCIGTNTATRALTIKDPGQIHVESTSTGNWVGMSIKGSSGTNNYNAYFGMLDSNGNFFIDNGSNGNDFVITQSGHVTKPNQPMVGCRHFSQNGSTVYNDGNDIVALRFHNVDVNVGSHFNNTTGIFTCPVAGNYFISCQSNLRAQGSQWSSLYIIYKPSGGSAQKLSDNWMPSSLNNTWSPIAASHLCNCNAGDELSMAYSAAYSAPSNSSTSGGVQMSIFLFG